MLINCVLKGTSLQNVDSFQVDKEGFNLQLGTRSLTHNSQDIKSKIGTIFTFSLFSGVTYLAYKLSGAKTIQAHMSEACRALSDGWQPLDGVSDSAQIQNSPLSSEFDKSWVFFLIQDSNSIQNFQKGRTGKHIMDKTDKPSWKWILWCSRVWVPGIKQGAIQKRAVVMVSDEVSCLGSSLARFRHKLVLNSNTIFRVVEI